MKRKNLVLVVVLMFGAVLGPLTPKTEAEEPQPQTEFVPGEILVKFESQVSAASAQSLLAERGLPVVGEVRALGVKEVLVPEGEEMKWVWNLLADPRVKYAEPNYLVHALEIPNDPRFTEQWNLGQIQIPLAWEIASSTSEVIIAIVDTGVDPDHLDLNDKIVSGYDFVNGDNEPLDDNSHGTHVVGIAAAETNNGIGIAGVAGASAKIMPVKVLSSIGIGTHSWVAEGIVWAANHGAKIINLSLGSSEPSITLKEAVNYAWEKGALLVAAAGNTYGNDYLYPAAYEYVLSVAATDENNNHAIYSTFNSKIAVAAPGGSKESGVISTLPENQYGKKAGTSAATPHVAGLAALLWSTDSSLINAEVEQILKSTALDLGEPGRDDYFGHGLINAKEALLQVVESGVLEGTVIRPDGTPIAQAKVEAVGPRGSFLTLTDKQGWYRLKLPSGLYQVEASEFWYEVSPGEEIEVLTNETTTLNLTLQRKSTGVVEGWVTEEGTTRFPIAGVKVKALNTPVEAFTDQYGHYELFLPQGKTYELVLYPPAGFHSQEAEVQLTRSFTVRNFSLQKAPTVLLVDADAWHPLRDPETIEVWEENLAALSFGYNLYQVQEKQDGTPTLEMLLGYDIVIWVNPRSTPKWLGGEGALIEYLDQGGRLLLTGRDVVWWAGYLYIRTKLLTELGNLNLVAKTPPKLGELETLDITGSGLFEGLTLTLKSADRANLLAPIHPLGQEVLSCKFREGVTGLDKGPPPTAIAVAVDRVPFRMLTLATNLDDLEPTEARVELLQRVLGWFALPQLELKVDRLSAYPGEILNYTATLHNTTNADAEDIRVVSGEQFRWEGAIPQNDQLTFTFQVKVGEDAKSHVLTEAALSGSLPGEVEAHALTIVNPEVSQPDFEGPIVYRWREAEYNWLDITGVGCPLYIEDSQATGPPKVGPFEIGFEFPFGGDSFSQFWVSDDGVLSFTENGEEIKVFNLNLFPLHLCVEGGTVWWWSNGQDTLVVTWEHVPPYGYKGGHFTFQVVMQPDGSITFQYKELAGNYEDVQVGILGLEIPTAYEEMAIKIWPEVRPEIFE